MSNIIHLIILTIFIMIFLYINSRHHPMNEGFIKHKIYLFFAIFIFNFVIKLLIDYTYKKPINIGKIANNSLFISLLAVIGLSIYFDLITENLNFQARFDKTVDVLTIKTIIIMIFVISGLLVYSFFNQLSPSVNDYLNKIYK